VRGVTRVSSAIYARQHLRLRTRRGEHRRQPRQLLTRPLQRQLQQPRQLTLRQQHQQLLTPRQLLLQQHLRLYRHRPHAREDVHRRRGRVPLRHLGRWYERIIQGRTHRAVAAHARRSSRFGFETFRATNKRVYCAGAASKSNGNFVLTRKGKALADSVAEAFL